MPTYDYQCESCDHSFELFQGINAPVETVCPKCNEPKLRRLIGTGAAVVFKGSGFYQTDYRTEGYKKSAAADKTGSTPSSGTDSSSSKGSESTSSKSESSASTSSSTSSTSGGTSSTGNSAT